MFEMMPVQVRNDALVYMAGMDLPDVYSVIVIEMRTQGDE